MLALRMPRRAAQPDGNPPPADPTALPPDLELALQSASVILRASGPDDGMRAVIQLDAAGVGFMAHDARAQLLRRWPGLTDAQLQRALRAVANLVRRAASQTGRERARWATSW